MTTTAFSSDAAAEEYRLAQNSKEAAREYAERQQAGLLLRERQRMDGLRLLVGGGLVFTAGTIGGIWQVVLARRRKSTTAPIGQRPAP